MSNGPWDGLIQAFNAHAIAWRALAQTHPVTSVAAFTALYGVAVAGFVPVALILTAIGGYLFGAWAATAASVCGATAGGIASYSIARWALAERIRRRFAGHPGPWQRLLAEARSGAFGYVFALRLIPMAPFGLVSIAAGAGGMAIGPYMLATALGIIPECAVYALAGQGLRVVIGRGDAVRWSDLSRPATFGPWFALVLVSVATLVLRRWWRNRSEEARAVVGAAKRSACGRRGAIN